MKLLTRVVLLMGVLAMTTGCLKFKQLWTVNPDGSGKMQMTVAISEQMLAMGGAQAEDPFKDFDPAKMVEQEDNGWVAFSKPLINSANGFKTATFTGYFEDINAVKFSNEEAGGGEEGDMKDTTYELADGKLTVTNTPLGQMLKSMSEDESMKDPQMKAMLAPMMAGLELSETYIVPGKVTASEGFTMEGSQASALLTDKDVLAAEPKMIQGLDDGKLVIEFTPAGWSGGEAAWKAELAAAKAEWAKLKQEAMNKGAMEGEKAPSDGNMVPAGGEGM